MSECPLDTYRPKGYVRGVNDAFRVDHGDIGKLNADEEAVALDAAVALTASGAVPFYDTSPDAGVWWQEMANESANSIENAIVSALVGGNDE